MKSESFCEKFEKGEITQEHIDGMKVIVKTLGKYCKELDMSIKEKEQKLHNNFYMCSFDYDDIRDDKQRLATCVDMRVFAEKTMRKYQHIKNERSSVKEEENENQN